MSLKKEEIASLVYAQDINDICQPLNHLNITYFSHVKVVGSQFSAISNNPEFAEHYIKNKYYNADLHTIDNQVQLDRYILWDSMEIKGISKSMDEESLAFGLNHAFSIIDNSRHEKNYYHFATKFLSPSINQVYLPNVELLEKFITYFNEKLNNSSELSQIHRNKKIFIENDQSIFELNQLTKNAKIAFLDSIDASSSSEKTIISPLLNQKNNLDALLASKAIKLTNRESDCILLILAGHSAKQISSHLGISARTVEEYTSNIKVKFNVHSKSGLIQSIYSWLA